MYPTLKSFVSIRLSLSEILGESTWVLNIIIKFLILPPCILVFLSPCLEKYSWGFKTSTSEVNPVFLLVKLLWVKTPTIHSDCPSLSRWTENNTKKEKVVPSISDMIDVSHFSCLSSFNFRFYSLSHQSFIKWRKTNRVQKSESFYQRVLWLF